MEDAGNRVTRESHARGIPSSVFVLRYVRDYGMHLSENITRAIPARMHVMLFRQSDAMSKRRMRDKVILD